MIVIELGTCPVVPTRINIVFAEEMSQNHSQMSCEDELGDRRFGV